MRKIASIKTVPNSASARIGFRPRRSLSEPQYPVVSAARIPITSVNVVACNHRRQWEQIRRFKERTHQARDRLLHLRGPSALLRPRISLHIFPAHHIPPRSLDEAQYLSVVLLRKLNASAGIPRTRVEASERARRRREGGAGFGTNGSTDELGVDLGRVREIR